MTTQPELDDMEIAAAVVLALIAAGAYRQQRRAVMAVPRRTPLARRVPALTWSHGRHRYGVGHA